MSSKLRKMAPGATRLYRFPPLLGQGDEQGEQAQFEFGYRQGVEQGVEQGYQDGLQQGRQSGHQEGVRQGHDEGYRMGLEEGRVQGSARFEEAQRPFTALQEQWGALTQQRLREQKELLAQVVAQVARRVIQAEYTLNPTQILQQVEQALTNLPPQQEAITIYLNEGDWKRLAELGMHDCQGWPLKADSELGVGDCRIESSAAVIEARTEERLTACLGEVEQILVSDHA
ncbi:FliH/SctL family protein [Aeromonas simiae]|uniref:FliH/SctL family protein n=1 Tax=Aeromonas simiae TaxID=218936 RepID=UPI00266C49E7|nr:FliH/SctL family protein [Aeromonas simiae]MDO2948351.1 FliH/SctL family protein [Aeromonas simiae]MDO2955734.1 FliH/SctL family protein [Aeromonas simiae]